MTDIQIILPATSDEPLSDMLVAITKAIEDGLYGGPDGYGLGGAYGYGADWNSDVFQMHRYCWCDGDECPWCAYSPDDGRRFTEIAKANGAVSNEYGCGGAPNFWHKASGMRVWWYKYIGRGMETANLPFDLTPIFNECMADIASAIEARRVETPAAPSSDESAVAESQTP